MTRTGTLGRYSINKIHLISPPLSSVRFTSKSLHHTILTQEQTEMLEQTFGCVYFVYNVT
ncbi:helix-turn-helix domain-containing protein [Photorhabdus caribbeanensis]|uniref:helix-turn-helix domain-containing protein n=1 Tax=Photorhabdus caribbeanensis TaxID=1004165 RepID=UPI003BB71A5F|nr:hypothetical protein [Photorhabdus caribbeanensis]